MSDRKEFEMSETDLAELLDAMKPQPVMFLSGGVPMFASQQERANDAWTRLGKRLGFKPMTVRPCGKGNRFFSAIAAEKTNEG